MTLPPNPILLLLLLLGYVDLKGQNLIPNPGFEQVDCPENYLNSFETSDSWYAINSDAYWLHSDCPIDDEILDAVSVFDVTFAPFKGDGFIILEAAFTTNGFVVSEGVGVELLEPLKAGVGYFFEMAAFHIPVSNTADQPPQTCNPPPDRFMEVHFGEEPISIQLERNVLAIPLEITSNADLVLVDQSALEETFEEREWYVFSDCFFAKGGERHMAISGNNFRFGDSHNCFQDSSGGTIFVFGHSLDDINLYEIPTRIDTSTTICEEGGWVDLRWYVNSFLRDRATFTWEDGCTDVRRVLRSPGTYDVTMELPCMSIPISLEVSVGDDCQPVTFSPEMPKEIVQPVFLCNDLPATPINLRPFLGDSTLMADADFVWPDGNTDSVRIITPGQYEIEVATTCFNFPLTIEAESISCQTQVYTPTAFSPNQDGQNDRFQPFIDSPWPIRSYRFKVYDRWGAPVFQTMDTKQSWDGTFRNKPASPGTYTWVLELELEIESRSVIRNQVLQSGEVTLIR